MAKSRPPEANWSLWQVAQLVASTGCRSLSKDVRATLALGALLAGAAVLGGCEELAAKSTLPANKVTTKLRALIRVPSQRIIATIVIRQNALKWYSKIPSLALGLCPQPEAEVSDSIGRWVLPAVGLFPRLRRWVKSDRSGWTNPVYLVKGKTLPDGSTGEASAWDPPRHHMVFLPPA